MKPEQILELEKTHAALSALIFYAERCCIDLDDDNRGLSQIEIDGDLPKSISEARLRLARLESLIDGARK